MPAPENIDLATNELFFHFETNNVVEVEDLAAFLTALARTARSDEHLGPEAKVFVRRIAAGSPTSVWVVLLDYAGNAAGVAQLGIGVLMMIEARKANKLADSLATLIVHSDTVGLDCAFRDQTGDLRRVRMDRSEIPAVLRAERRTQPRRRKLPGPTVHALKANDLTLPPAEISRPALTSPAPRFSNFATQRWGSHKPDRNQAVKMLGRFAMAPDGTGTFETGKRTYRIDNPGVEFEPVPLGPELVIEGQPFQSSSLPGEDSIHVFAVSEMGGKAY